MRKIFTISFDEEEIKAIMYWFMMYQIKSNVKGHTIAKIDTDTAAKIAAKANSGGDVDDFWKWYKEHRRFDE